MRCKACFNERNRYDYWKQCDQFDLSNEFDTEENRALAERNKKKNRKTYKKDKNKQDKKRKSRGNSVKVIKVKKCKNNNGKKLYQG